MDIATAKSAAALAAQIEALQALIADIDLAITETQTAIDAAKLPAEMGVDENGNPVALPRSEGWLISSLVLKAPAVGSARPEGSTLNLLVGGKKASAANSLLSMQQAKTTYEAALAALTAQLAGM